MAVTGAGPHRVVVLNPKGGCGKTTLATNVAAVFAFTGRAPTLVDLDPQGYSSRWADKRDEDRPRIRIVGAAGESIGDVNDRIVSVSGSEPIIFDLPAAIPDDQLHRYTYIADSILIPVMPSDIDVHAATRLIAQLMLDAQLDRRQNKVAIVANRVRKNTRSFQSLLRFLGSLEIPLVATLRDSQNFVLAAGHGLGVCELPPYKAREDLSQLAGLMTWLDQWPNRSAAVQRETESTAESSAGLGSAAGAEKSQPTHFH